MPRVFFRPDLALSMDPPVLAAVLDAFGRPAAWAKRAARDARVVARWLWGGDAPATLVDRLAWIARFADARGRDALVDAMADARARGHFDDGAIDRALASSGAPLASWSAMPAIDLAARVAIALAREPRIVVVVERAEHAIARHLPAVIPFELATKRPRSSAAVGVAYARAIADALAASAREESAWAEAWCAEADDGSMMCAVLRASPSEAVLHVDADGATSRETRATLAADVVRIDADAARLSIATSRPSLVSAYARAVGGATHADPSAFFGRAALTLKKLQALGSAGLAKLRFDAPIASVEIVSIELHDGKGVRKKAHGVNAFAALEAETRRGGYVVAATVRFVVEGDCSVDAYVELPHRLSVSDARFEDVVRGGLRALGAFDPGAIADDVATLAPWVHPEWRWRDVLGDEAFARAVKTKLLVRTASKKSGARVSLDGEGWLGARVRGFALTNPSDRGAHYAVAEDPSVRPRSVTASALAMIALDAKALARRLRNALGLRAPLADERIALPKGIVDTGVLDLNGAPSLRFVRLVRAVGDDERETLAGKIRRACGGKQHVVVLVPEGRTLGKVLVEAALDVPQQLGVGRYEGIVLRAARDLRIDDALPARHLATRERPLVISVERDEAHLGGVLLDITENQVRMLAGLARDTTRVMHVKDLGQLTSPGATHADKAVRKTRSDLDARVAESFAREGETLPEAWKTLVVQVGKKGYRLGLGAIVR